MSSLTWSIGSVTLVFHCAIPSSRHSRSSSLQPFCRMLSCNCTLPRLPTSATPKILQSTTDSLHSGPEPKRRIVISSSGSESSSVQQDQKSPTFHDHHRSVLQSVLSLVVALTMTIGIQGAPSSRDTFEDVPQTLSGKWTSLCTYCVCKLRNLQISQTLWNESKLLSKLCKNEFQLLFDIQLFYWQ